MRASSGLHADRAAPVPRGRRRRAAAAMIAVCAVAGCTRMDAEVARVRAQISLGPPAPAGTPEPPPPCVGANAEGLGPREHREATGLEPGEHRVIHLGGVMLVDFASPVAWRYATGRRYARHLPIGSRARKQIAENGPDGYVAAFARVAVPAGRTATISVDAPENFTRVSLIPGGPSMVGGYYAVDGEPTVRCEAGATETAFPLGVIVEGPRCASITVQLDGAAPESRLIGFGRRQCP